MKPRFTCEMIVRRIKGDPVRQRGSEIFYHCWWHPDEHPSFQINTEKDCFFCGPCDVSGNAWQLAARFAGVSPDDKTGVTAWLRENNLLNGRNGAPSVGKQQQRRVKEFSLGRDQNGTEVQKVRLEPGRDGRPKDFIQEHRLPGEKWQTCHGCKHKLPLYANRAFRDYRKKGLRSVMGFEGEGKVELAEEFGIAAFSYKTLTNEQSSELAGLDVILWPDKDTEGTKQANDAAKLLQNSGQVKRIGMITPPAELPERGDIVDAVRTLRWGPPEIARLVAEAKDWQEPAEWRPEAGAEILGSVMRCIRRFVSLSEAQACVAALWVAHTHAIEAADCTPYLNINSPEKQSGKTRLLEVFETVVQKPWLTGRVSAAALSRKIDAERPALLLDESDTAFSGEKEYAEALRGLLDTGYRISGRSSCCVGQGTSISVKDFSTFCPKAIAGIGRLPGTVADRSIPIKLRRAKRGTVEKFHPDQIESETGDMAARLASWCNASLGHLRASHPEMPPGLSDRQEDCVEPLLAIADLAGGEWPAAARRALVELCAQGQAEDDSIGVKLLADIKEIFYPHSDVGDALPPLERIASADLVQELGKLEDRPWIEWGKSQKPITAPQLARLLARYEISPNTVRLANGRRLKGYEREQFLESWAAYLPPDSPAAPSTPDSNRDTVTTRENIGESGDFASVTGDGCHASENAISPNKNAACHGVTDQNGRGGGVDRKTDAAPPGKSSKRGG